MRKKSAPAKGKVRISNLIVLFGVFILLILVALAGLFIYRTYISNGIPVTALFSGKRVRPIANLPSKPVCSKNEPGKVRCLSEIITPEDGVPMGGYGTRDVGYGPKEFHQAYKMPCTPGGSVQTTCPTPTSFANSPIIAITIGFHVATLENDLNAYTTAFGIPPCTKANGCLSVFNQTGGTVLPTGTDSMWSLEGLMDVEVAHAVCQTCRIYLYEATTNSWENMGQAFQTAVASGATSVSNSWGANEWVGANYYEKYYNNHPGVFVAFSSGDSGWVSGFPVAMPSNVAVGGTQLSVFTDGTYAGETAWAGSGSGCSLNFNALGIQMQNPNWSATRCGTKRALADISADAAPNTGASVYDSQWYGGNPSWFQIGGTSLSSPLIAAMYAVSGKKGDSDATLFYQNYTLSRFHDITSGTNGSCGTPICIAGIGYDGVTGLGSPNGVTAFNVTIATPSPTLVPTPISSPTPTASLPPNTCVSYYALGNMVYDGYPPTIADEKFYLTGSIDSLQNWPAGVTTDKAGNIYYIDTYISSISRYTKDFTFLNRWGSKGTANGQFIQPSGMAFDSKGYLYVVDFDKGGHNTVTKFDTNGKFVLAFGQHGTGKGQFGRPFHIAIDGSDNIFVSDVGNNKILRFDSNGTFITEWGSYGSGDGQFSTPWGIGVDSNGIVYVVDSGHHQIQEFTKDGVFLRKWGSKAEIASLPPGLYGGQFFYPTDIEFDSAGNIYILDSGNARVQKLTKDHALITQWLSYGIGPDKTRSPSDLAIDPSGSVFVYSSNNQEVDRYMCRSYNNPITPTKTPTPTLTPTKAPTPTPTPTPPIASTITGKPISASQIQLNWDAPANGQRTVYFILYRDGRELLRGNIKSFLDRSLETATTYTYYVQPITVSGQTGPVSNNAVVTTFKSNGQAVTQIPGAPGLTTATKKSATQISIQWAPASGQSPIRSYKVYRDSRLVSTINSMSYVDKGLMQNTAYSYFVKAVDANGVTGPKSNTSSATTR